MTHIISFSMHQTKLASNVNKKTWFSHNFLTTSPHHSSSDNMSFNCVSQSLLSLSAPNVNTEMCATDSTTFCQKVFEIVTLSQFQPYPTQQQNGSEILSSLLLSVMEYGGGVCGTISWQPPLHSSSSLYELQLRLLRYTARQELPCLMCCNSKNGTQQ